MPCSDEVETFGVLLRRHRQDAGLTQSALAERAGLSARGVQNLERGLSQPYRDTAQRLAEALALSPAQRTAFEVAAAPRPRRRASAAGVEALASPSRAGTSVSVAPPLDPPNNLPVQRDPLIGREQDLLAARQLVLRDDVGLVTLVGAGGTGKTRVALRLGSDLLGEFGDGVYFVPLASLTDPRLVTSAIAQAVGIRDAGSRPLLETLREYLRHRHQLLIIDNFEHVLSAAPLLAELLEAGARLKIVVTSRAALRLHDEQLLQVPPLALPEPAALATEDVGQLRHCPSVMLFLRRVAAADPSSQVEDADVVAAGEICVRLDGLPLAIELAAARVRIFPPQAMRERLERRLPFLTSGPRDLPTRQQTLRSAIAWSYDLLTPDEQRLFRHLAMFQGGCTLATLRAVFGSEPSDEPSDIVDTLHSLVDKSLVERHGDGSREPRFTALETIREFGLDRLDALDESAGAQRRHAAVFLGLVEQAARKLTSPERGLWVARLEAEHDNVRAALAWSQAAPDGAETMLRITGALGWFWYWRGHLGEGRQWVEAALARGGAESTLERARALFSVGLITFIQGDHDPMLAYLEESVGILRGFGTAADLGYVLTMLGIAWNRGGDPQLARRLHGEGRAVLRGVGDRWGLAFASTNEGAVCAALGDDAAASDALGESATIARALGDGWSLAHSLMNRALMAFRHGDLDVAVERYRESLAALRDDSDRWFVSRSLQGLASVEWARGYGMRAAHLWGAAEALLEAIGAPTYAALRAEYDHDVPAARVALGDAEFSAAWQAGRALSPGGAIAYALAGLEST